MPITEGKGLVPPTPLTVRLVNGDHANVRRCTSNRARYRRYASRPDAWGQGSVRSSGFDEEETAASRAVYAGFGGEWGYRRWRISVDGTVLEVDETPRPVGDCGVDFNDCGYGVQVKAACSNYGSLLIRQPSEDVPPVITWDIVVRAQYPSRRVARSAHPEVVPISCPLDFGAVDFLGWAWRHEFLELAERNVPCSSPGCDWLNMELEPCHYKPMRDLASLLVARNLNMKESA